MQMRAWYEQSRGENITTSEFWQLCAELQEYRRAYAQYWRYMDTQTTSGRGIDGVVQPVAPYVAGHQNDFQYYSYSAIANVLDVPAAAFPVSSGFSLTELANAVEANTPALSEEDERVRTNCGLESSLNISVNSLTHEFSDRPHDSKDMPVGLQVLGRRLQEEAVLAMTQAIWEALQREASNKEQSHDCVHLVPEREIAASRAWHRSSDRGVDDGAPT